MYDGDITNAEMITAQPPVHQIYFLRGSNCLFAEQYQIINSNGGKMASRSRHRMELITLGPNPSRLRTIRYEDAGMSVP